MIYGVSSIYVVLVSNLSVGGGVHMNAMIPADKVSGALKSNSPTEKFPRQ